MKLTEKEIADIDYAIKAIYKQSAKVPFKPFKEQTATLTHKTRQNALKRKEWPFKGHPNNSYIIS